MTAPHIHTPMRIVYYKSLMQILDAEIQSHTNNEEKKSNQLQMIATEFRSSHNCFANASNCMASYHSHNLQAIELPCNCAWVTLILSICFFRAWFLIILLRWINRIHTGCSTPHAASFRTTKFMICKWFGWFCVCVCSVQCAIWLRLLRFNYSSGRCTVAASRKRCNWNRL